jgi:steroid 5-alpha reductase family enzyme
MRRPHSRSASMLICLAAYLAAAVAAFAVVRIAPPGRLILAVLLADLAATLVVFGFSMAFDNSSMYDPYWSVAPVAIAAFWLLRNSGGGNAVRQVLVVGLLVAWAARLTVNCLLRWKGLGHEDWRYADFRIRGALYWPISFLGFHVFPTLIVFLGCVSLFPALGDAGRPFGGLDAAAAAVTAAAIWIEWASDRQLRHHLASRARGKPALLETGLWSLSRHPNYFGEVLFWWGLWLFGLAASPAWWWTVAGPVAVTTMFLVVSVPMMDRHMLARRPEYAAVVQRRSGLVPWFTAGPSGSRKPRRSSPGSCTSRSGRSEEQGY